MTSICASTSFAPARRQVRRPSLLARWLASRRDAAARRQLAELPPHLRRDVGLPPATGRLPLADARSFDHNSPAGSPGAYW